MKLIDTHTHLYAEEFDSDRGEAVSRALASGVEMMLLPDNDSSSVEAMEQMAIDYPQAVRMMVGIHPEVVKEDWKKELSQAETRLRSNPGKYVAIGEIGLDYYWDRTYIEQQKQAFRIQLEWALEYKKPVSIHVREAFQDLMEVIHSVKPSGWKGVIHCFSGTLADAEEAIGRGFLLGIGGVLTFKKSTLPEVVSQIGMEHFILETDSPYLAPVPYRGKRNESAFVVEVARKLAQIKGLTLEEVAEITTRNAQRCFELE